MKALIRTLLIVVSVALLSSCSSMFSKIYQDVDISTSDPDAELIIDEKSVGTEKAEVTLKKDLQAKSLVLQKEGYKPEYRIITQTNRPKYFLFNLCFGWFGAFMIMADRQPNAFKYDKEYYIEPEFLKYPEQSEDEKYIFLNNTAFDLGKNDIIYRYRQGKNNKKEIKSEYEAKYDNTIFTSKLTELLSDFGYLDTTTNFFENQIEYSLPKCKY